MVSGHPNKNKNNMKQKNKMSNIMGSVPDPKDCFLQNALSAECGITMLMLPVHLFVSLLGYFKRNRMNK